LKGDRKRQDTPPNFPSVVSDLSTREGPALQQMAIPGKITSVNGDSVFTAARISKGNVIQAGGQGSKMARITTNAISRPKPVPTGGMWLVETDAANGLHQQVRVGEYFADASAVSFGYCGTNDTKPTFSAMPSAPIADHGQQGDGEVYKDDSSPKKVIQHFPMNKTQVEKAKKLLNSKVGARGAYSLLTNNCVHWSMQTFDSIKNEVQEENEGYESDIDETD